MTTSLPFYLIWDFTLAYEAAALFAIGFSPILAAILLKRTYKVLARPA